MGTSHSKEAEFVSIGEAARRLGVSVITVRRWEAAGRITGIRTPTGVRRFPIAEIDRLTEPTEASA